eukprot:CAMPEP_0206206896 /NCGR_PEP_ID=MMETSP0166-20121206/15259_1 /ASSEMBLY_ACC=CAM_ASM_000260 /TAXON_ID=95228 /ORGANISM="Vannella robusta, Strain DIVA3 518/3/11/1/6" /LENGTH=558 /DNA_ID=CAMNT_0053627535 /DNA_START=94 /DNA_END=1767 /DNA_ORIENTATION=+
MGNHVSSSSKEQPCDVSSTNEPEQLLDSINYSRIFKGAVAKPKNVKALKCRHLDLSHNTLTGFPRAVMSIHALEVLCTISTLTALTLTSNRITKIPAEIIQLRHLVELNMKENSLRNITTILGELPELRALDISNNSTKAELFDAEFTFQCLSHLESLNMSKNKLNIVQDDMGALKNLKYLHISSTEVLALVHHLPALETIEVSQVNRTKRFISSNRIRCDVAMNSSQILEVIESYLPTEPIQRLYYTIGLVLDKPCDFSGLQHLKIIYNDTVRAIYSEDGLTLSKSGGKDTQTVRYEDFPQPGEFKILFKSTPPASIDCYGNIWNFSPTVADALGIGMKKSHQTHSFSELGIYSRHILTTDQEGNIRCSNPRIAPFDIRCSLVSRLNYRIIALDVSHKIWIIEKDGTATPLAQDLPPVVYLTTCDSAALYIDDNEKLWISLARCTTEKVKLRLLNLSPEFSERPSARPSGIGTAICISDRYPVLPPVKNACYSSGSVIVLDVHGKVWVYGNNSHGRLGLPIKEYPGEVEEFIMLDNLPPIECMFLNNNSTLFVDTDW